jgi:hypothetical protein
MGGHSYRFDCGTAAQLAGPKEGSRPSGKNNRLGPEWAGGTVREKTTFNVEPLPVVGLRHD